MAHTRVREAIGSVNSMEFNWHQAITWTCTDLSLIGLSCLKYWNSSEICIEIIVSAW